MYNMNSGNKCFKGVSQWCGDGLSGEVISKQKSGVSEMSGQDARGRHSRQREKQILERGTNVDTLRKSKTSAAVAKWYMGNDH